MEMTGSYRIAAPRDQVWAALNDPAVLKDCIPGCESLEKLSDTEMQAVAAMKIGPVKARFSGKVTLTDLKPPESYTISGEGTGGAAGFAKGGADVALSVEGEETVLTYTARAQVGGKIAQLGARLIDGVAKKTADDFFAKFSERVGGGAKPASLGATAAAESTLSEDDRVEQAIEQDVAANPPEIGAAETPGAPGPVPEPEHRPGVPAAPATNPPEAFIVPSQPAIAGFLRGYGGVALLIAIAIIVFVFIVSRV
jgi:carbon monoxide dehydrogenase subunit G